MELLKNSMRATVEKRKKPYEKLSPIKIIIADGEKNEDVSVDMIKCSIFLTKTLTFFSYRLLSK